MNKVIDFRARAFIYRNRLTDIWASAATEPSQASDIVHVSAGYISGQVVVAATKSDGIIVARVSGYSHTALPYKALGTTAIDYTGILFVDATDGQCKRLTLDTDALQNGTIAVQSVAILDSGQFNGGAFIGEDGVIAYYDNGGLRVKSTMHGTSPDRLYNPRGAHGITDYNAACNYNIQSGCSEAYMSTEYGIVLYRNCGNGWEHQRIALPYDLSLLQIDGAVNIAGGFFVYGRYKRQKEYDDGSADMVLLPVVDDVIAMPPYSMIAHGGNEPFAVALTNANLLITTFNRTALGIPPEYVVRTEYTEIPEGDIADVSLGYSNLRGNGTISLSQWRRDYDIRAGDAIRLQLSDDGGTTWRTYELIANQDAIPSYYGLQRRYQIAVMPRAIWLIANARMPNYIELKGADTVVDTNPGERKTLFPIGGAPSRTNITEYTFDTWLNYKGFEYPGVEAVSKTEETAGGSKLPFWWHNKSAGIVRGAEFYPKHDLYCKDDVLVYLFGWSNTNSTSDNVHDISLYVRLTDANGVEHLERHDVGKFVKTWNGTAPGDYPLTATVHCGDDGATIKGIAVVTNSHGDGVTMIGNITVYSPTGKLWLLGDDKDACAWDDQAVGNTKALVCKSINRRCLTLSTTPYDIRVGVDVFAEVRKIVGDKPLTSGTREWGIALFAKDAGQFAAVVVRDGAGRIDIVKVDSFTETVLATMYASIGGALHVMYEGGSLYVYDMANSYPGTLIGKHELGEDGIMQSDDASHVGVYTAIFTHGVQVLTQEERGVVLASYNVDVALPNSGTLAFSDGSTFDYSGLDLSRPPADGPWEARNIYNWPDGYSDNGNTGWAIEFKKLCWGCNVDDYKRRVIHTDTGYTFTSSAADTTPYIKTNGQRKDLPNRMRLYSPDISGTELIGTDTRVWLDGFLLTGNYDGYVTPYGIATLATTEHYAITLFSARERGILTLTDTLKKVLALASVRAIYKGVHNG